MEQVGKTVYIKTTRTGKKVRSYMTYKDVPKDENDWADPKEYLPRFYDLVHLKMSDGSETIGWRSDSRWDGRRFKPWLKIVAWKKADNVDDE